MHITVVCPQCKSRYQVDDALRGKKMRCPSGKCKAVFDVVAEGNAPPPPAAPRPAPPSPAARPSQSGSVSDMVPLLSAEAAPPPSPTPAPALGPGFADWRAGPPARGGAAPAPAAPKPPPAAPKPPAAAPPPRPRTPPAPVAQPAPGQPAPSSPNGTADWRAGPPPVAKAGEPRPAPVEMPPGAWETPPGTTSEAPVSHEDEFEAIRAAKKRRARRLMIGMIAFALLVLGIGGIIAVKILFVTEEKLYAEAKRMYEDERFSEAARQFRKLLDKFPDSSQADEFRFFAALSDLRGADSGESMTDALEKFNEFLTRSMQTDSSKKLLEEKARDLGQTFVKKASGFFDDQKTSDNAALEKPIAEIESTVARLLRQLSGAVTREEKTAVDASVKEKREQIATGKEREKALVVLREMGKKRGAEAIKDAKRFIRQVALAVKGFEEHEEVQKLLGEMHDAHRAVITYTPAPAEASPAGPRPVEDTEPSILLDSYTSLPPRPGMQDDGVVLALVRGMLYALAPNDGQIKWAMRVGIDSAHLPVRLPAAVHAGERLLVMSDDARLLTALDLTGRRLWDYRLGAACLGQPLIVKNKAYLPTFDGQIHEIRLTDGKLEGRWQLGQPLSVGGAHQKGTNLVYFPADDTCVYILDVVKKQCEMVLYTNHLAGSLRGEPLIIGGDEAAQAAELPAFLLMTQAGGFDETELKLYQLPIKDRHTLPVAITPPPRIQGWTWFTPYTDSEKVVCLSDAGRLGLFGIRQARNRDKPLFPLIHGEGAGAAGLDLAELLKQDEGDKRGRALVAYVQGDDLWVLTNGRLHRLEVRLNQRVGPQAVPRWKNPLELGAPLHAEQVRETANGSTLFLVTQPVGRPVVLVTAVDPEAAEGAAAGDARLRWQRQLGLVCQGEPIVLGGEVLAMDRAGGLFRFKAADYDKPGVRWLAAAKDVGVAPGMDQGEAEPPQLIRADDRTVYAVSNPGGTRLVVRKYQTPGDGGKPAVEEMETELQGARLAGSVALQAGAMIVPLSNGTIVRYALPLQPRAMPEAPGLTWRSRQIGAEARCHIVALEGSEFLTTDGLRGMTRWSWPAGGNFRAILPPQRRDPPGVELANGRIVGAPAVLPRTQGGQLQVFVADSDGGVTLVTGNNLEQQDQRWELKGRITAGPFVRGPHIGCVVDHTRLVWIDPAKESHLWIYKTGGEAIVGMPRVIDDLVVVCDEGGRYIGLKPLTGEPAGEGYRLKAAVAPAAAPAPFGKGKAFAPLTDGTMMLLSLERLRAAPPK